MIIEYKVIHYDIYVMILQIYNDRINRMIRYTYIMLMTI